MFDIIYKHNPDKIALSDKGKAIRYSELENEVSKRAESLYDVTTLAIALDNSVEWVLWDLAAMKAGIPCVPLPPFFTQDQVFHALHSACVSHILSPTEGLRETGSGKENILPKATVKVTFTSGTTGSPKGVCLPQTAMENVAQSIVELLGDQFVGTHASVLPLAVLLENVAGVYAALIAGCTVQLTGLWEFGENYANLHRILNESRATSVILVPEILRILMRQVAMQGALPELKFIAVGGSKIDLTLVTQARSMGLPVYEGYGLSECASVVFLNTPENNKIGSVGQLLPHVKARIADGEIQIKNPGFLGYVGEEFSSDVFQTGDLGEIDKEGFLNVTGRKKNVLITSYGRNISPEWVEAALLTQPSIAQVVVYGDAQPHLSALIVPSSHDANIEESILVANSGLPEYAQIKDFQIVPPFTTEEVTLTGTGRPRREKILTLYTKEKTHDVLQ